jgi:hypothetical protein
MGYVAINNANFMIGELICDFGDTPKYICTPGSFLLMLPSRWEGSPVMPSAGCTAGPVLSQAVLQ